MLMSDDDGVWVLWDSSMYACTHVWKSVRRIDVRDVSIGIYRYNVFLIRMRDRGLAFGRLGHDFTLMLKLILLRSALHFSYISNISSRYGITVDDFGESSV